MGRRIKPVAGTEYTIVKGDTLWDIAAIVYGSGTKYTIIWEANKQNLRSNDPHWIYPGEKLWIPFDTGVAKSDNAELGIQNSILDSKNPNGLAANGFVLSIDGEQLPISKGSVKVSYSSPADGFAAELDYMGSDQVYDLVEFPFKFRKAALKLGYTYSGNFIVYNTDVNFTSSSGAASVEGFSQTVDLLDCTPASGITGINVKFSDWIKKISSPYGIGLEYKAKSDPLISKVRLDKEEVIYSSIQQLADKYNLFISQNKAGDLVVQDLPASTDPIVATIGEGGNVRLSGGGVSFKGRNKYTAVTVYGTEKRKHQQVSIAESRLHYRHLAVSADTLETTELYDAAYKAFYDADNTAMTLTLKVESWYNPKDDMWWPGQLVALKGRRFLLANYAAKLYVKTVEFILDGENSYANLTVCPLRAESGGGDSPWIKGS